MKVILTSKSELKTNAVKRFLKEYSIPYDELICVSIKNSAIPNQPVNSALECALMRINSIEYSPYDLVISLENGVEVDKQGNCYDVCVVVARHNKYEVSGLSDVRFKIPIEYYHQARRASKTFCRLGTSVTVGEVIASKLRVSANNWMAHPSFGSKDRNDQLFSALSRHINDDFQLRLSIIYDETFKKGIVFKDLSPILANPRLKNILIEKMHTTLKDNNIRDFDKVVGLDSRGYIYANMLQPIASKHPFGFVMARKKGKTPSQFCSQTYTTEYSEDTIEIQEGLIHPGDRVLLVDDLIATGGSLNATKKLIDYFGGEVVGALVILQVDELIEKARQEFGKSILVVL